MTQASTAEVADAVIEDPAANNLVNVGTRDLMLLVGGQRFSGPPAADLEATQTILAAPETALGRSPEPQKRRSGIPGWMALAASR